MFSAGAGMASGEDQPPDSGGVAPLGTPTVAPVGTPEEAAEAPPVEAAPPPAVDAAPIPDTGDHEDAGRADVPPDDVHSAILDPEAPPVSPPAEVSPHATAAVAADESVGPLALPPTTSDAAQIAWLGTGPEPAQKLTLQQALSAVAADGTVSIVPNASGYRFATILTVPTRTTVTAATATLLYGRLTVSGAGLSLANTLIAAAANSQVQVTVSGAAAQLTDVGVVNPEGFTGTTGIALAATADDATLTRPVISGSATGINLGATAAALIRGGVLSGVTTGILVTAANASRGPQIEDSSISFTAKGVTLGGTVAPALSGLTLTGPGAGTTYGIDYQNASGILADGVDITGVLHGISTSTPTTTAEGPEIRDVSITATGNAIGLGATSGASVTAASLTRLEPTNNAAAIGVNVLNATSVTLVDVDATGFRDGIAVAANNSAPALSITGGTIAAVVSAVTLGASVAPTVTDLEVVGQLRPAATAIATVGVELASSTGASISGLVATDVARGVNAPSTNASTGLRITGADIVLTDAAAATGINLGATVGAVVEDATVIGAGRGISRSTGITTNRASAASIIGAQVSDVATGIGATWIRLSGRDLAGHTIEGAIITGTGIGIYTANTTGTTISDTTVDAFGEGIAGHEDADLSVEGTSVTGHTGTTFQNGTNCIRFYYTDGIAVTDVTTVGGATGLYLDMSTDAVVDGLDASGATWYATYAESVTGFELRNSTIHDNAGIGNLTINPTSADALDRRQVSSDILFEDSTFTDNVAGLYLPLGAFDITFQRNTVTGTSTYVVFGTPVHGFRALDNDITFTHDPALLVTAETLASAQPLPEPPLDPPLGDAVPENGLVDTAVAPDAGTAAEAALVGVSSAEPPSNAPAAFWIAPQWFNLDTDSASSSDIAVRENRFVGDGPFIGVGTTSTVDKGTPDAPADPSAARTLRDTVDVSLNVFPRDSTAIVTVDNAEQGLDGDDSNSMTNGDAAVDARGDNDWGSPCYARVPTDAYDGGGAFIHELRVNQVLYPQACAPTPTPPPPPTPTPTPTPTSTSAPDPASTGGDDLAGTGGDRPVGLIAAGVLSALLGTAILVAARAKRRASR